jgi:hypothetical protein
MVKINQLDKINLRKKKKDTKQNYMSINLDIHV